MPTTNDNRSIKITAKTASTTASDFSVDFAATFTTDQSASLAIKDKSSDACDLTIHELTVSDPATGEEIGRTSIRVKADTKLLGDLEAKLDREARATSEPPATAGGSQVRDPSSSDLRRWAQPIKESGANVLRNIAVTDVRSVSASGGVSQTVRTNDESSLVLDIAFTDRGGSTVASGTVTLATSATAGAGFELGPVTITDTEDDGAPERRRIR
jgi:hypothetical protein